MPHTLIFSRKTLPRDLIAGLVVFLVALPLCLGVALASNAPLFSGVLAGIIGGLLVGVLSGSHVSVSGPAAGLTAVVSMQIATLGSFRAFLLAVLIAGLIQVVLGLARAGFIAAFFPSSVIKGLLAAIGVILILKQFPHVIGHDTDPEGEMSFRQPDHETTFSEIGEMLIDWHQGAAVIGLISTALLLVWDKIPRLQKSVVPAPLVVVLLGMALFFLFREIGGDWAINASHLVQVPVAKTWNDLVGFLQGPDFSQWSNPAIYFAALTLACVASLETLLNLEAVDKLDPRQRMSPPSRELFAQGVGNMVAGLCGAIPLTSVIIRSSVNIAAGSASKLSTIVHGLLLLVCVVLLPVWLNRIPLSCLAAILLVTGCKLASPKLFKQMWAAGRYQFLPFVATVVAIVFTDLLVGVMIGLAISVGFILHSNMRRPLRRIVEKHLGGEVLRIELASQVSFLNRAVLEKTLRSVPRGGQVLIDARNTNYVDPDVLDLFREFHDRIAPAHGVQVSMLGFRQKYHLDDSILYVDYSNREIQSQLSPQQVLQILKEGNERFRNGQQLTRDFGRQVSATSQGQHPLAVVLSCIDSRTPAELLFDLGLGDIFSIRIAGNVTSPRVVGSIEYGCAVAGAKLVLVMGHTRCGAVTAAVNFAHSHQSIEQATGCQNLEPIVHDIQRSLDRESLRRFPQMSPDEQQRFVDQVAHRNVSHSIASILDHSQTLRELAQTGRIAIVHGMYDVSTGAIEFLPCADPPRAVVSV